MKFHPAFSSPAQKFNLFGGQVLGAHHGGGAVLFLKPLIHNQPLLAEFLGHGCARIRRWMLNIRPVHITAGKFEIGFNRLARIARAADDQSAHHIHLVAMQSVVRSSRNERRIRNLATARTAIFATNSWKWKLNET